MSVVKTSTAKSNREVLGEESSKNGLCKFFSCLFKKCSIPPSPETNLNNLENERVKCIVIKEINGMPVFNSGFQYLK